MIYPFIGVCLQLFQILIQLLSKGNLVELVQDSFVKAFTDAVGLRRLGFFLRVIDVLDGKIKLVFMMLAVAAVFGARGRSALSKARHLPIQTTE